MLESQEGKEMDNRKKIEIDLNGPDGNIYAVIGIVAREIGRKEAQEMQNRVFSSKSYEEALEVINEYVELVDSCRV